MMRLNEQHIIGIYYYYDSTKANKQQNLRKAMDPTKKINDEQY